MPLPKLKNSLSVKLSLDSVLDLQISFSALAIASKNYPKSSVKLVQSGRNLAQSVKLWV